MPLTNALRKEKDSEMAMTMINRTVANCRRDICVGCVKKATAGEALRTSAPKSLTLLVIFLEKPTFYVHIS